MGKVLMSGAGGGGTGSDECTASRAQVLSGYTAVTSDSDDELATGTMANNGGMSASLNCGQSKSIPAGYTSGGTVTANSLASQTAGNLDSTHMVSGYSGWSNGTKVSGSMVDRGAYQWAGRGGHGGGGMGEGTENGVKYYSFNNIPDGWYHNQGDNWSPEIRLKQSYVWGHLGVKAENILKGKTIADVVGTGVAKIYQFGDGTVIGFASSDNTTGNYDQTYTVPGDGRVYYSGFSASYRASPQVICEIWKNTTLVDSRNIDSNNRYSWRGTMINKSFAVSKGDIVRIVLSPYGSTTGACAVLFATVVYYN